VESNSIVVDITTGDDVNTMSALTSIKIRGGNLDKVKLWNINYPENELL
jgi:hypothetical protein